MRLLCLGLLVACAAATPAQAATVAAFEDDDTGIDVEVRDARGDPNDLLVIATDEHVLIRERKAARLRALEGCRSLGARTAVCPGLPGQITVNAGGGPDRVLLRDLSGIAIPEFHGGSGDDRLESRTTGAVLDGGSGEDRLQGSSGADQLYGGAGEDVLTGGKGADLLDGDASIMPSARLVAHRPAADILDGGKGRDLASWAERRQGVRVDLRQPADAGAPGERDELRSIENLSGGRGRDRLTGDSGPNSLLGGPGPDRLAGGPGRDRLNAGRRLPGTESFGADRARDRVSCGPGVDRLDEALDSDDRVPLTRLEVIPGDCERLDGLVRSQLRRIGRGRVALKVTGSRDSRDSRRRVTLTSRGRILGRSRIVRLKQARTVVAVRLRRSLPQRGIIVVRIDGDDAEEDLVTGRTERYPTSIRYRLRRGRPPERSGS